MTDEHLKPITRFIREASFTLVPAALVVTGMVVGIGAGEKIPGVVIGGLGFITFIIGMGICAHRGNFNRQK